MNHFQPRQTDALIGLMRNLPILWLKSSKINGHNSKDVNLAKAEAWKAVAENLRISIKEAKEQWAYILLIHRNIYGQLPDEAFRYDSPPNWDPHWDEAVTHISLLYAQFFQEDLRFLCEK
ncbi:unnamed protein product, partial [Mesorhabditis spiculigera]